MAFEKHDTLIDGHQYSTTTWSASKLLKIQFTVLTAIGEPLGRMLKGVKFDSKDGAPKNIADANADALNREVDVSFFMEAFSMLANTLTEDQLENLMGRVFEGTMIDNRKLNWDADFSANTILMAKVAYWLFEVNCKDFFDALKKIGIGKTILKSIPNENPQSEAEKTP